jgi:hypothetical protein
MRAFDIQTANAESERRIPITAIPHSESMTYGSALRELYVREAMPR